jgi:glycosyltransferase involved in cell wall biosynthesis
MKIALVFNKDRADTTGCYFERVLERSHLHFEYFPTQSARRIGKGFDLYLRIDHGDYKYDLPCYLRPKAFLAIDTHLKKPYKKILRQAKHYDFVFVAQKEGALNLSKALRKRVDWIPLACEPEIHKKLNLEKKYDVGFVGSYGGKGSLREELLLEVKSRFPNSFIGGAPHTKMAEIYSSSKIGLNYSLNNDINMRIFEILCCGAMLITNKIKENGFDELFKEGHHLVTYTTKEELINLIVYYLRNDKEREAIAQAGHTITINHHTYRHRIKKMFEIIRHTDEVKFRDLRL